MLIGYPISLPEKTEIIESKYIQARYDTIYLKITRAKIAFSMRRA